jgi:hypothetical protein
MKTYAKLTLTLIAGWFAFALVASALHVFQNNSNRIGIAVGVAATVPILVFGLWYAASGNFRRFILALNPQLLTVAQSWRLVGFTFVLLQAHEILPAVFAWPAGYGDMLIGATATLAAWKLAKPSRRASFMAWQILGIADLVSAVGLGTTARLLSPDSISMGAMTVLPLSLVPTFLVPLFFIFHLICIAQARRWMGHAVVTTGNVQPATGLVS